MPLPAWRHTGRRLAFLFGLFLHSPLVFASDTLSLLFASGLTQPPLILAALVFPGFGLHPVLLWILPLLCQRTAGCRCEYQ